MPIYSLDDLRAQAPKELQGLDDAGLIRAFSEKTGKDPAQVADYLGYRTNQGMWSARGSASVDNYQGNMLGLGEAVANALGADDTARGLRSRRQDNELDAALATRRAQQQGAVDDWRNVDGLGSLANYEIGRAHV